MNKNTDIDELFEEIEENVLPPDNIVVLNELRSASDLYRLMTSNSIEIQPDFQRDEVWDDSGKARFIDSLSKEFPIPSMCFALDPKEQKYIVIDGLQRMSTIKKFLGDPEWIIPSLNDIDKKISGRSVFSIKNKSPEIYRRVENISLPVTILRYDPKREDNMDYIFTIFQRLNTFGERLNNQEIRNAIYQGPFNSFIKECAKNPTWNLFTKSQVRGRANRMISEERVLRFFAFYDDLSNYEGKLNKFLNEYMNKYRYESDNKNRKEVFESVIEVIKKIGLHQIGKSNALKDAALFGIAKNLPTLKSKSNVDLRNILKKLSENEHFSVDSLSGGIMQKLKVNNRLVAAKNIFT